MNIQLKRVALLVGFGTVLVFASNSAFALGRGHKSGYRGWNSPNNGSDTVNNGGTTTNQDNTNCGPTTPPSGGDSNPVPEPASLVLFGSALAGLGGYRGLRQRLARR